MRNMLGQDAEGGRSVEDVSAKLNDGEMERDSGHRCCFTPSPPTKSLGFGGFDSSKLLILKGGNSHVRIIL